jgi:putative hydrolase of the HAD superfamily
MTAGRTIYLFDWGNTLMEDDPNETGPMFRWATVSLCGNAGPALEALSRHHDIYLATNARDSDEADIRRALDRVGIGRFITGIFCYRTLGVLKPSREFFQAVVEKLTCRPEELFMVGDDPVNDAAWALENGARAVLYDPGGTYPGTEYPVIRDLMELVNFHDSPHIAP